MASASKYLLRGKSVSLTQVGRGSGRNTKIALKVKDQGQILPQYKNFYHSPYQVTPISDQLFFSVFADRETHRHTD